MKAFATALLAVFATAAVAAPTGDHIRRSLQDRGHKVYDIVNSIPVPASYGSSSTGLLPTGTVPTPYSYPTGVSPPSYPSGVVPQPYPNPTGVSPQPSPYPTGSIPSSLPSCPVNGAVVCNGSTQFGLCNWGHVFFMDVADGTACIDGEIVGTGIYAVPTPSPTA